MAIGSGLGSSVGVSKETTYGTYVAPTKFCEYQGEDLKRRPNFAQGGGLAAGRLARSGSRRVMTFEDAGGPLKMDVPTKGFGVFLENLMGTTVTPVQQAATIAYLQTHIAADNLGKKLTLQKGVPQSDGTVKPFTYLGSKLVSAEFTCGIGEFLATSLEFDSKQEITSQSLAAPSYPAAVGNFAFREGTLKLGAFGAEASVSGVTKVTLKIDRPMKVDTQYLGNAGLKTEPILNGDDAISISGTIEADFLSQATFYDRFYNNTSTSMILEFVSGTNIASTYYYTIRFKMPQVFFEGDSPTVDGPDVVGGTFPFVVRFDDTNPVCTIEYLSTDVTI